MRNLVIVESPGKKETIQKYLGEGWRVEASYGHIRDLPNDSLGIDKETWEETYVPTDRGATTISKLRKLAHDSDLVWLASDLDREGESIAWHLKQSLGISNDRIRRIVFSEITKTAIKQAVEHPIPLDLQRVNAQRARRVLDRLAGYEVSPVLSRVCLQRLSAGRVQSVAVRLLAERERAITAFKPDTHYTVELQIGQGVTSWRATLDVSALLPDGEQYLKDQALCKRIANLSDLTVSNTRESDTEQKPPAPFITSTLQQAAANALKLTAKQTMQAAQRLYEAGLITYMRTDSTNLSDDAIEVIKEVLVSQNYSEHIVDKAHRWGAAEGAQEAHEAIRPSDPATLPEDLELGTKSFDKACTALYGLIRQRTLSACLKSAQYHNTKLTLENSEGHVFNANGRICTYLGWKSLLEADSTEDDSKEDVNNPVPALPAGEQVESTQGNVLKKVTIAPKRYTESSLIKTLEASGVGRPSTYASIIDTVINRGYTKRSGRFFEALPAAYVVTDALLTRLPFIEIDYTANMERALDDVSKGERSYKSVLSDAWRDIEDGLECLNSYEPDERHLCPKCTEYPLRRVVTPSGAFWGCSDHPNCNGSLQDLEGRPFDAESHAVDCPECGHKMQRFTGAKGAFWGCSDYKNGCKYAMDDENGSPVERIKHKCPKSGCAGELIKSKKKADRAAFWFCSNWKDENSPCDYKTPDRRGKPQPFHACPTCGQSLRSGTDRQGSKNWFCSGYKSGCSFSCGDKRGKPAV